MSDPDPAQSGVVVVGVDGSSSSRRALRWALRQASATAAKVVAVQAWEVPRKYGTGVMLMPGAQWDAEARNSLRSAVEPAAAAWPGVVVEQHAVEGHPVQVLLDAARNADLLVLGNRGLGGFAGALLGSVSQHCVRHASCPVVVVHDRV
ncbi:universal stress protein [Glycomyces albidus]|uniref:Universal stress protein n=1 Tax=Glycomyces albidus TaxID=2656774 RepID=A0A6L5G948_9ACTN|nr:universal stress protein [Glycomyces albidus]MQM26184.1 universal stress protein [Glycomyces albidus]